MGKLTIDDLKKIKEQTSGETSLRHGEANVKITVHMGTCGIAAGARDVMNALMEEMAETERQDIRVMASGCLGMCSSEPNVTVEVKDEEPIVYQHMDANKIRRVFAEHVLGGRVVSDLVLRYE